MRIWGQRRSQSIKHRLPAICSAFCWRTDAPLELSTRFGPTSTSETRKWHSHFCCNMVIWLRNCCCKYVPYLANWLSKYKIRTFESPVGICHHMLVELDTCTFRPHVMSCPGLQLSRNPCWQLWESHMCWMLQMAPTTLTQDHSSTKTPTYSSMESKHQTVKTLTWAHSSPRRLISFMALWVTKVWGLIFFSQLWETDFFFFCPEFGEKRQKNIHVSLTKILFLFLSVLDAWETQLTFSVIAPLFGVGKVLVHCARGISRSATLALAYLMIKERLTLVEAVEAVRRHRNILPNVGFLNQLCVLDSSLALQRKTTCGQINLWDKIFSKKKFGSL